MSYPTSVLSTIVQIDKTSNFASPTSTRLLPVSSHRTISICEPNTNRFSKQNHFGSNFNDATPTITIGRAINPSLAFPNQSTRQQQKLNHSQVDSPKINYPLIESTNKNRVHHQPYQLRRIIHAPNIQGIGQQISNLQPIQVPHTNSIALPQPHPQQPPKPKGRKNQEKLVFRVPSDKVSKHDVWAWRKYGEKSIKGSTFPRSYYKCSTCNKCVARRHVERCKNDPNMFILTYLGHHEHLKPNRRNANAGISRKKNSSAKNRISVTGETESVDNTGSSSTPSAVVPDPMSITRFDMQTNNASDVVAATGESESPTTTVVAQNDDMWEPFDDDDVLIHNLDPMSESYLIDFDY